MLSHTLDQTMAKAMKYENMTSAIKLGNYFKAAVQPEVYKISTEKLAPHLKHKITEEKNIDDDILDYIVEDPNCIAPVFNFDNYDKTGLPFFKSLGVKLNIKFDEIIEDSEISNN